MRFYKALFFLLFPIWLFAQPGPFGGFTMSFRVYSPNGDMVLCGDKSYEMYLTYTTYISEKYASVSKVKMDTFSCNNSHFEHTFSETIARTINPQNIIINIIHGNDTMQVFESPQIDSVPFRKGRYYLNTNSLPFYLIKKKNHAKVNNLNWELLKIGEQIEHPQITFIKRGMIPVEKILINFPLALSPDSNGYLVYSNYSEVERICCGEDNTIWSQFHETTTAKFEHFVQSAPPQFTISDLKFTPKYSNVTKSSWAREPLLSFYVQSQMHFINSTTAYMQLLDKLYKTTDGGNEWNEVLNGVSKYYYNKDEVYAVTTKNEYARIRLGENTRVIGRFKTNGIAASINSIQFQNDSVAYFLVSSGTEDSTQVLYKSVHGKFKKKPLLRFLPSDTKLIITNKGVVLWFGAKTFWQSLDGGTTWTCFDDKNEYTNYSAREYPGFVNAYAGPDGTLMGNLIEGGDGLFYGNILLDEQQDSLEKLQSNKFIKLIIKRRDGLDSIALCNCIAKSAQIKNNRQIENGTYYATGLKFLIDRVNSITLQDGEFEFVYYAKDTTKPIKGIYIATESSIAFHSKDTSLFFNGTYYYLFDGNNFSIYHCKMGKGKADEVDFYKFGRDSTYHDPVTIDQITKVLKDHASNHLYSFTPDSEKIVITLVDTLGKGVENASIKLDDIYAKPQSIGNMYYFDKRMLAEFQPGNALLLLISHPDYDPLVVEFSGNS
ncbi:MAG TPA: hypothetical protein VK809_05440, partial [Bacteroidia bacterium]|nr:hypothetical protein [Bacteroidia bacterium]